MLPRARAFSPCSLPSRFSNILKSYTDCLEMHYGFLIGRSCDQGYRVELEEVLRVMDMLDARAN
jgi:hypothetical protein